MPFFPIGSFFLEQLREWGGRNEEGWGWEGGEFLGYVSSMLQELRILLESNAVQTAFEIK